MSQTGISRGFVFVAIFLFVFAFLVSVGPVELLDPSEDPDVMTVPDEWVAEELLTWGETFENWGNQTILAWETIGFYVGEEEIGGRWLGDNIYLKHRFPIALGIIFAIHDIGDSPHHKTTILDAIEDGSDPQTARLKLACGVGYPTHSYTYFVSISYNATNFDNLQDAWEGVGNPAEIRMFIGMGWEESIGSVNAWSVISQLLLFKSPDIQNSWINTIIGFSLWTCIVYMAFVIVRLIFSI